MSEYKRMRWHIFDLLRGYTLLNMVLFHFLYDVFIIYGRNPDWLDGLFPNIWQQWICCTFIMISGIVFHFSRKPIRRGIVLNLIGFAITGVTIFMIPEEAIRFGILNLIGCAILMTALLQPWLRRIPSGMGLMISLLLFLLCEQIPDGFLGCYSLRLLQLPDWLYQTFAGAWLGFPNAGFTSSDYFPLIPWLFVFWGGYYLQPLIEKYIPERTLTWNPVPVLSSIGRNTIWVYIAHQPILMVICMMMF